MPTLFEIRDDLAALDDLLSEVGGDVTDEQAEAAIDEWLAETGEALAEKLDDYAGLIREVEARGAARKAEADRLRALAATDENTVRRLKERLRWFFADRGLAKLETPRFRLTLSANGGKVPLELLVPAEALPEAWRRTVVTYQADQDAIRAALDAGNPLPFARLGERGSHIRIR